MSVQKRRHAGGSTSWRVQYRDDAGRNRSRSFDRKADADAYDREIKRRRQLGPLADLDGGRQTLTRYVSEVWAPTYGAHLASSTRGYYADLYGLHLEPFLGGLPLNKITAAEVRRWQSDRLDAGGGPHAIRRALRLLGTILQHAAEEGLLEANVVRVVRPARVPRRAAARPLGPEQIERLRRVIGEPMPTLVPAGRRVAYEQPDQRTPAQRLRDSTLVAVLAYAGLRPGEALALRWADVGERTLLVERALDDQGRVKDTKTNATRSVRLLGPLAADLRAWRLASGRPSPTRLVFPETDGRPATKIDQANWRTRRFHPALKRADLDRCRVYDLRHSFASLLLAEGRTVHAVAQQLGHGAELTLTTYGHVLAEFEDSPRVDAEARITAARAA